MTTIDTRLGKVLGIDHGTSHTFLGIRYGKPPSRFMPPVAADGWNDILDATAYPTRPIPGKALGSMGQTVPGEPSEDCLFLNIYTPSTKGAPRPVMVWIHGGGFANGSANEYDGRVLASQGDVVVVIINYRLGPFGFTDLSPLGEELEGSVSNGYRDMILALEWIRDNITDYGGNADNVTIFGESAGGIAVLGLNAAPAADGLFHKAIAHSPNGPQWPGGDKTGEMAEKLGVDQSELLDKLRGMSTQEIIKAGLPVGHAIDGTVVTRPFNEAILEKGKNGVPIIVGTNRTEGTLFTPPDSNDEDIERYQNMLPGIAKSVDSDPKRYVEGIRAAYPEQNAKRLFEIVMTDSFRRIAVEIAESASQAGAGSWLYRFDLPTTLEYNGKLTESMHACEMAFTFNSYADSDCMVFAIYDPDLPEVRRLAGQWSGTLTRFAWTGDPNGAGLPEWSQYKEGSRLVMHLDATSHVSDDPDKIHRELWVAAS